LVRIVFGGFAVLLAASMLAGIWVPRFRICWKGSGAPFGWLSSAGFALGIGAVGAALLTDGIRLPFPRVWFAVAFVPGWICAAIGWGIDANEHRRSFPRVDRLPTVRPINKAANLALALVLVIAAAILANFLLL